MCALALPFYATARGMALAFTCSSTHSQFCWFAVYGADGLRVGCGRALPPSCDGSAGAGEHSLPSLFSIL
jgi:hypothetical protein